MGVSSAQGNAVGFLPPGCVMPYAGSTSPAGWLLCAGQAVSRTEYGALFAVVGTTYGTGDGSTTFNLPDLRGRTVAGVDNMGGTAASRLTATTISSGATTRGNAGGAETHTLTSAESGVPAHQHTQAAHQHYISENGSNGTRMGGHFTNGSGGIRVSSTQSSTNDNGAAAITESATPTINNNTTANASSAHNNVQPTMVMNYIIKAVAY